MVNSVLVLGGGSAGFLAAVTLKRRLPVLDVVVVRSPDVGVIGVGEGTTVGFAQHVHGYLGLDVGQFHREAEPVWKLGGRFLWGPRPHFDYTFGRGLDLQHPALPKATGYMVDDDMADYSPEAAIMARGRVFPRGPDGLPAPGACRHGYHLENATLIRWLEQTADRLGVRAVDATVAGVEQGGAGVSAVVLADGRRMAADLFVDASGFRSVLLRGAMAEPTVDFGSTLWCDRAVVGGWDRGPGEAIRPYTTVETMDAGWAWRIDHERRVNRGYVYSGRFLDDAAAEAEFRRKNPRVGPTRVVRFPSGRAKRAWVANVVGVGNAYGFVEPLEATNLGFICSVARNLAELLADGDRVVRDCHRHLLNAVAADGMDAIRWFLGLHYKFNDRLDTPFWRAATGPGGVDVTGVQPLIDAYREVGPTAVWRSVLLTPHDPFGPEGYLVMLVGQRVPYRRTYHPTAGERATWAALRAGFAAQGERAVPVAEALHHARGRPPTAGGRPPAH